MSTHEDIIQALRSFAKAYAINGTALTNSQVIPADDKGPRPATPYLTVKVMVHDIPIGQDVVFSDLSGRGDPQWKQTGQRSGTVSMQGFGAGSDDWLGNLMMSYLLPGAVDILDAAEIDLHPMPGGVTDLSTLLDTAIEERYLLEWDVTYELTTDDTYAETGVELEHVIMTTIQDEGDPSERTVVTTIDL